MGAAQHGTAAAGDELLRGAAHSMVLGGHLLLHLRLEAPLGGGGGAAQHGTAAAGDAFVWGALHSPVH